MVLELEEIESRSIDRNTKATTFPWINVLCRCDLFCSLFVLTLSVADISLTSSATEKFSHFYQKLFQVLNFLFINVNIVRAF